jgi:hypothetical protein
MLAAVSEGRVYGFQVIQETGLSASPSPIPADSSVSIGSAASSPSHVWLFGTDDTTGEPMILSHS